MHTPLSLARLLARNRTIKSPPPPSLAAAGIACLSPADMQRLHLSVTDAALLTHQDRACVVRVWPLATVPDAFAALDDATMATLSVVGGEVPGIKASPGRKARRKKKGTRGGGGLESPRGAYGGVRSPCEGNGLEDSPRGRREREGRGRARDAREGEGGRKGREGTELPTGRMGSNDMQETDTRGNFGVVAADSEVRREAGCDVQLVHVEALSGGIDIADATAVDVVTSASAEFLGSEEYTAMVHDVLVGRILLPGMIVPVLMLGNRLRLVVKNVQAAHGGVKGRQTAEYAEVTKSTKLRVLPDGVMAEVAGPPRPKLLNTIGGLDVQITELLALANDALSLNGGNGAVKDVDKEHSAAFTRDIAETLESSFSQKPRGVLLHGPPGTGKTLLACALAEALNVDIEVVCGPEVTCDYAGDAVQSLESVFARARRKRPCVVLLDEVDTMAPRRDAPKTDNVQRKLTATLLAILDGHDDTAMDGVFVIGTTSQADSLDAAMRRAGRFDSEIEVTVPNTNGRLAILHKLSAKAKASSKLAATDAELAQIAGICYGFVGADMSALWRESVGAALRRAPDASVSQRDMREALKLVQPSALREVAVEIPHTNWSDIGGKADAKLRLKEAVEWPLTPQGAALFASIGVTPPKGILLFGPPGCSKTLLARAVATESGANFISVKGPELLSKWVGESEKSVRNMFRRARLAAPCVIFFDEVDALAGARGGAASAQSRVVAQLLAEMDGIDSGGARVVVIAATNRPDCLDDAFVRPGRIDAQIYVGLPDEEERLAILKVSTRQVPIQGVHMEDVARRLEGFSGAEVCAVVREAGLAAMESDVHGACQVNGIHFETAIRKVQPRTPAKLIRYFEDYIRQRERRQ